MSVGGYVRTSPVTGAKAVAVPGYGKMVVHDKGNGNVFVTYNDERSSNLTYEYGGRHFPVWEPYAFRESPEYVAIADSLMASGTWCPKKDEKKERSE